MSQKNELHDPQSLTHALVLDPGLAPNLDPPNLQLTAYNRGQSVFSISVLNVHLMFHSSATKSVRFAWAADGCSSVVGVSNN